MRIVLHGQQAFGQQVLERLLAQGENVVAVCTAPDRKQRPPDPVKQLAVERGLPVHQPASWKTPEALALMQSFRADVCMMAYVLLFVPSPVLNAPRLGSFQYHPSLLPMHRGPSSINWPIANGETQTGLSIFWPDDGLDEGPILLQKTCDIGPDDTLGDVYFKRLFPLGVEAMMAALEMVKLGTAPHIQQDLPQGSYESWFGRPQAELDWRQAVERVYNIIRAGNPQPGAWSRHNGRELTLFDVRKVAGAGRPGEVIAVDEDSFTVAANGGGIQIFRVRADAGKVSAKEYIQAAGITRGDMIGGADSAA